MLQTVRHLLSLIRFSHTIFALPFALLSAVMAFWAPTWVWPKQQLNTLRQQVGPLPDWSIWQFFGILLCMVFARSAAMAFNRLIDRRIDAENPRTAGRHIPAGILSVSQVTAFTIACSLGFVASTLLFLPNRLPLYLSVPVLAFLCGYSFAKRFTSLAHVWLGTALALSPIAVWIAIRGEQVMLTPLDLLPALVLGAVVLTWVTGFDIIYACQDYEFDRARKLHSIPARLGVARSLRLAASCHAATVALLAVLPLAYPAFGLLYWGAVVVVAGLLIFEHALVRPDDLMRVNIAFFNVNAVISLGLFAVGTLDLWLSSR